jgi:uncharacterized protein
MARTFLKAEWRKLVMANYVVDAEVLQPLLPLHTELDLWEGKCYVSLVGFLFVNTKVKGLRIPYHVNFEEVNLRFYVKHFDGNEWKRGVVFVKEIVPRFALTFVANILYGEPYITLPMSHTIKSAGDQLNVEYRWIKSGKTNALGVVALSDPQELAAGSEEEFITEHFWGYTKRRRGFTSEYEVAHPRWVTYPVISTHIDIDFQSVYGARFAFLQNMQPHSVFLAEGSEIVVKGGKKLV